MGKNPTKENTNVYFRARKQASMYDQRLFSREGASELLGVSVSTLADYELGTTKVVPVDKVVLMADLYGCPELKSRYCMKECPIHGFLPLATEKKSIQGIALRLLQGLDEDHLKDVLKDMITIAADGEVNDGEVEKLSEIELQLESIAEIVSEMKICIGQIKRKEASRTP